MQSSSIHQSTTTALVRRCVGCVAVVAGLLLLQSTRALATVSSSTWQLLLALGAICVPAMALARLAWRCAHPALPNLAIDGSSSAELRRQNHKNKYIHVIIEWNSSCAFVTEKVAHVRMMSCFSSDMACSCATARARGNTYNRYSCSPLKPYFTWCAREFGIPHREYSRDTAQQLL
jgi:hypothetical protein